MTDFQCHDATSRADHVIDLDLPEEKRWDQVIRVEARAARRLAHEALEGTPLPRLVLQGAGALLRQRYISSGGRYVAEMDAWARGLGLTSGEATLLNCAFELSHIVDIGHLGCTAGVIPHAHGGPVHVRNLDWPLTRIGQATRLLDFRRGKRSFYAVGVLGFVGVLSGMLPGRYSVTINWAPSTRMPGFDFGPAFLLREVLETTDSFDAALAGLRDTPLSAPAFFTLCGSTPNQACVIERTRTRARVRRAGGEVITQANHHVAPALTAANAGLEDLADSGQRAASLKRLLRRSATTGDLNTLAGCLDHAPVLNAETRQQMAFRPATGEVMLWRR